MIISQAEQYAANYHKGQFRKISDLPYVTHPKDVVDCLKMHGYCGDKTLAIAWLHDTIEDTSLTYEKISDAFGREVADGVYLLTRNVDREEYKKRLETAPNRIKMIKLCDTLDNIKTLVCLSRSGIEKKVVDCKSFYIPMAQELCPQIAAEMKRYIDDYLESNNKLYGGRT